MNGARARTSLLGLSVGDAFGETMARPGARRRIEKRLLPLPQPWRWTDDTAMAISVVETLERYGEIDPDELMRSFVERWRREPHRGYGLGAFTLLQRVAAGANWRVEAQALFRGQGSFGNGAAMRAAPIGAFFAPDLDRVRREALRSAEPTHAHPEGAAGAVAVAIAAAAAATVDAGKLLDTTIAATPESAVRRGLRRARELGPDFEIQLAGEELGTGCAISARDTVPFCIWVAARLLRTGEFDEAIWAATSEIGDSDTNGAIVGGIMASATGVAGIPLLWRIATEPLPPSVSAPGCNTTAEA
jgi:ADP-ribosylglycohydrolase